MLLWFIGILVVMVGVCCCFTVSVAITITIAIAIDINLLHNTLPVVVSKLWLLSKHQSILFTIRLTHHIIIHLFHICTHLIVIDIVIALFIRHLRLNKHWYQGWINRPPHHRLTIYKCLIVSRQSAHTCEFQLLCLVGIQSCLLQLLL